MEFGDVIRERRLSFGLSLRKTAKVVGCDVAYLSRIEAGKISPSDDVVGRLASVLLADESELALMAGRLPASARTAVDKHPREVAAALKEIFQAALGHARQRVKLSLTQDGERAIDDGFPFEVISEIAEAESWRKEIYRPIYHVHKWWAQRLGSVFRAAIIASAIPKDSPVHEFFLQPVSLEGVTVFDPFMGSGTTVGEAHKLGCTTIGRDINPVAYRAVCTALGPLDRRDLARQFDVLSQTVAPELRRLYRSVDSRGRPCDVLYYFWVKVLDCPRCEAKVDIFPRYVFTRHADRTKDVRVFVLCPACNDVFPIGRHDTSAECPNCHLDFDPRQGPAKRTTAVCQSCGHEFKLAATARAAGHPPAHRMYAKLVLRENGAKEYLRITEDDLALFGRAKRQLTKLNPPLPRVGIKDGRNTRQITNYGYHYWHQLFNERQLLALTTLAQGITRLPDGPSRDALSLLFSGTLEFNNMFASYKGEGTGAVRHMFSHHILKPERMPIEANLWGTPQSSGAFSTLYRTRLMRAIDYREKPFEIALEKTAGSRNRARKVYHLSPPMGRKLHARYPRNGLPPGAICLSCGSSSRTDLPDQSVDLIVTDPPFFDNVHYSELADFFHVWQQEYFWGGRRKSSTTRHSEEVQDTDALAFAEKLRDVFAECFRILRDGGRLVFSYHHSREDGWSAIARAVIGAGFKLVQAQPVKSEMSVAAPKSQAKEPIDLDVLLVCRKRGDDTRPQIDAEQVFENASHIAIQKVDRFNKTQRQLSRNDVRVVVLSQLLVELSAGRDMQQVVDAFSRLLPRAKTRVEDIWSHQQILDAQPDEDDELPVPSQLRLF